MQSQSPKVKLFGKLAEQLATGWIDRRSVDAMAAAKERELTLCEIFQLSSGLLSSHLVHGIEGIAKRTRSSRIEACRLG